MSTVAEKKPILEMRHIMKVYTTKFVALGLLCFLLVGCTSAAQPVPEGIYTDGNLVELSLVKGHWFINHGTSKDIEDGSYLFSGNQIKFSLEKAFSGGECDPAEKTFSYQWSFDGKSITLTNLDDKCVIRAIDLANAPLLYEGPAQ